MAQPQYPQLLRALAKQRLGAGDTAQGSIADWHMLSQGMRQQSAGRAPGAAGISLSPSAQALATSIRQKLALRTARTGRPPMVAPAEVGSQIPTAVRGGSVS